MLEFYERKKIDYNENYLGEKNMVLDRIIVMDGVPSLADRSEEFANFPNCITKIRTDLCLYFPYYLPEKTALADDTVTDKNI